MAEDAAPPSEPFDAALYEPLGGAEPMGPPISEETAQILNLELPKEIDAARGPLSERRELLLEQLETRRDLRLLVRLYETDTRLRGVHGLHAALHLLHAWLTRHWDTLNPAPPEDPDARLARMIAFGVLTQLRLVWGLAESPVFNAGGLDGEITLRAFYLATEQHAKTGAYRPRDGEFAPTVEGLKTTIARANKADDVARAHAALTASATLLRSLSALLAGTEGYDRIDLRKVETVVGHFVASVAPFVETMPAADAAAPAPGSTTNSETDSAEADAPGGGARSVDAKPAQAGALTSQAEALALIDSILVHYARTARSSPVALALIRIRERLDWTFEQWMNEVADYWPQKAALKLTGVDVSAAPGWSEYDADEGPDGAESEGAAAFTERLEALRTAAAELREACGEDEALSARIEALAGAADALGAAAEPLLSQAAAAPAKAAPQIASSADVKTSLKRLAVYYRTAEPSSPAYLCFERLAELVDSNFLDILRRIAPDGVSSAALILAKAEPSE